MKGIRIRTMALGLVVALVAGCSTICRPVPDAAVNRAAALHNVHEFAPGVFSGSAPESDAALDELAAMGIRTILSVDGARPQAEAARARGMRYAHVPIGYDGMSGEARLELARVIRDAPGPIYVHCHHGRHRGPTAAAVGLFSIGAIDREEGLRLMTVAGAAESYTGLWACMRDVQPLPAGAIDAAPMPPEVAEVSDMAGAMAVMDRAWDNLKACQAAGWAAPEDHPDLAPIAEAGRVHDTFRVVHDMDETAGEPEEFLSLLARAVEEADALERSLGASRAGEVDERFTVLGTTCTECHATFRD